MKTILTLLAFGCLVCLQIRAADRVYQVANSSNIVAHWPAADGWIGTTDDVVSAASFLPHLSGANTNGSFSYNAFDFGGPAQSAMPTGRDAITFVQGNITLDLSVAQSGGGPLIKNWQVSGTEPYSGHGPYSASIVRVNSGSYNPATHVFTQSVDFTASLNTGIAIASNFVLSGEAYVIESANFGTATGHAYVDNVLRPLAIQQGASSMVYMRAAGTIPASSGDLFPSMPFTAVMVGLYQEASTNQIRLAIAPAAGGVRLSWTSEAAKTYVIEATDALSNSNSFAPIASNLLGPDFVDSFIQGRAARFYRLR
jgi:hypothetical protein